MRAIRDEALPRFLVKSVGPDDFRLPGLRRDGVCLSRSGDVLWLARSGVIELGLADGRARNFHTPVRGRPAWSVGACADGQTLVTRVRDGLVRWRPDTDAVISRHETPKDPVGEVFVCSPREAAHVAYTKGGWIHLLDFSAKAARSRAVRSVAPELGAAVQRLAYSADGSLLFVLGSRKVLVLDATTAELREVRFDGQALAGEGSPVIAAMQVVGDDVLVSLRDERAPNEPGDVLRVAPGGRVVQRFERPTPAPIVVMSEVSRSGRLLAATPGHAYVMDAETLAIVASVPTSQVASVLLDAGRDVGWIVDESGALTRCSLGGTVEAVRHEPSPGYSEILWSDDGLVVQGDRSPAGRVDIEQGTISPPTEATREAVPDLATRSSRGEVWGADGNLLRGPEGASVRFNDVLQGRPAISPSGRMALVMVRSSLALVDLEQRRSLGQWTPVKNPRFLLASDQLAVVLGNEELRWIDARTGAVLAVARVRAKEVERFAASPGGGRVALLLDDTTVVLIDRTLPSRLVTFEAGQWLRCLAFSPDGTRLACAGDESVVRIFSADQALAGGKGSGRLARAAEPARGDAARGHRACVSQRVLGQPRARSLRRRRERRAVSGEPRASRVVSAAVASLALAAPPAAR